AVESKDWNFSRVQITQARFRGNRLFENFDDLPAFEDRAIFSHEEVRLLLRKQVVIGFSDQLLVRIPEELFTGAVEAHKAQVARVFYKNHRRKIFDHRIEKFFVLLQAFGGGAQFGRALVHFAFENLLAAFSLANVEHEDHG